MEERPRLAEPRPRGKDSAYYEHTIIENEIPVYDTPADVVCNPVFKNTRAGYDKLHTHDVGQPFKYTTLRPVRKHGRNAGYINMNKTSGTHAYENAEYMLLSSLSVKNITQDENVFVETPSFEKARDLVARNKVIVITGPPGSGKTAIGRALLRHYGNHGFTPLVFHSAEDFHIHPVKSVILLDNVFGKAIVNPQTYPGWAAHLAWLDRSVQEGENLFIIVLYRHILKQLSSMPDAQVCGFHEMAVVDLGSAKPLTSSQKIDMLRRQRAAYYDNQIGDDEISDILASDKSGPLFPWCCRQYAQFGGEHPLNDDDYLRPYVSLAKDPFLSLALAYLPFFKEALQEPQFSEEIAQHFALIMAGYSTVHKHDEEIMKKLSDLGFDDDDAEITSDLHYLNEMFRGSILDEEGGRFSNRDIYNAFGFALWETDKVELMLKACDVRFLVQHVKTEAEDTGPTFILTPKSPRYFDFVYRLMAEIMGGNLIEISQHPALHHPSVLADLMRFLQGRGQLEKALSVTDRHFGMTLLYWSAWVAPSQLTQWCLRTRGAEAVNSGPEWASSREESHTDPTDADSGGPEVSGGPKSNTPVYFVLEAQEDETTELHGPDRATMSEPEQVTATPKKSSLKKTEHENLTAEPLASGARTPSARASTGSSYLLARPLTDLHIDTLRRTFLACCLLGEKVNVPRVADMLEMLCQDTKALDDDMAPVLLPIPPQDHVLTAACRDRCQLVRENPAPAFYLGLTGPASATSTSHVSIPSSIVTVDRTLNGEGVQVKPNRESCDRWYTLIRLVSMCSVNELNRDGYTLLHTAAFNGELNVVWFLAVNGADLSVTSCHGNTPLTKAIERNQVKVATFLLLHGCHDRKPNIQDLKRLCGQRSVDDLVRGTVVCKRVDLLKLLLRHGADPNSRCARGRSLLTLARAVRDNDEVIDVLQKHGAKEPKPQKAQVK